MHFENVVPQQACSPMATALNAMESNLATLSSASEPDCYNKSQADAKFEAVDTQLAAKATRDELAATKVDLKLATDAVAELKTLFAAFKASTDEKMKDLEAQLQERKRKRADQDAKNNIAATAANDDDNGGESNVGNGGDAGDNGNQETNPGKAGWIIATCAGLGLVLVVLAACWCRTKEGGCLGLRTGGEPDGTETATFAMTALTTIAPTTSTSTSLHPTNAAVPSDGIYGPVKMTHKSLFAHVVPITCEMYAAVVVNPLGALAHVATPTSVKAALKAAAAHCGNLDVVATAAAAFAESFDLGAFAASAAFACIHVAVINAYTQESPLYEMLNATLGGYGPDGRKPLKHYLPVAKLLNESLKLIKPVAAADGGPVTLFRGVKMPASVLLGGLKAGDTLTWWSFTSTTTTSDVLQSTAFLGIGEEGAAASQSTKRTVFHIKAFNGINIKPFSAISDEDEVLFRPGSQFVIDGISEWHYGITEVRMHQVPSTVMPVDDEAVTAGLYDLANAVYDDSSVYDAIDDYMVPVPVGSESATVYAVPLDTAAAAAEYAEPAAMDHVQTSAVPRGNAGTGQTAMRCLRPSPTGGACKKIPTANSHFCKSHACPQCGESKSSSKPGCPKHPTGAATGPKAGASVYNGFGHQDNHEEDC